MLSEQQIQDIRREFPILSRTVRGNALVYLDNASTTQKPKVVLDRIQAFYAEKNANVHRGLHYLSEKATEDFDAARETVRRFLNAPSARSVIFTKGCTEAINLVAQSWGSGLGPGDEILLTQMEHHSNIVPWQLVAQKTGAAIRVIPITEAGEVELESFRKLLSPRVKLVGVVHVSNALGSVNPVAEMTRLAHEVGARVVVDGAQGSAHVPIDVAKTDVDFYAFSGHKVFGPMGIGVLYGKTELLDQMPPYQGGGDMIETVSFERSTFAEAPQKFEAGTPNVPGAIGLAAALDFISGIGIENIVAYEEQLVADAVAKLSALPKIRIVGTAKQRAGVVSFLLDGVHPHDVGTILDSVGVAVRTGHHCCMPLMSHFKIPGTVRASFSFYNTAAEIVPLVTGINKAAEMFRGS